MRFDPDFVDDRVAVTLRNVDRLETVTLDFEPAALDTQALPPASAAVLAELKKLGIPYRR